MQEVDIEYHADDYGLFPAQSQEILDCCINGRLNAVSIMPNSPYLAECMELLWPYQGRLKTVVHLNFFEGHCLCPPEQVPHLADARGIFTCSFGKLLLAGFSFRRKEYGQQLREEIRAQIHEVQQYLTPGTPLRIDGHAHWHMLPVVFDSLIQVLQEEKLAVEYIRFPDEKLSLYLRNRGKLSSFKLINLVKAVVLKVLVVRNRRKYRRDLASMEDRLFLGVALSGNMTLQNVRAILPDAIQEAEEKGRGIELLAHPGGVYLPEDIAQLTYPDDVKFLTSEARRKEKEMFCGL